MSPLTLLAPVPSSSFGDEFDRHLSVTFVCFYGYGSTWSRNSSLTSLDDSGRRCNSLCEVSKRYISSPSLNYSWKIPQTLSTALLVSLIIGPLSTAISLVYFLDESYLSSSSSSSSRSEPKMWLTYQTWNFVQLQCWSTSESHFGIFQSE